MFCPFTQKNCRQDCALYYKAHRYNYEKPTESYGICAIAQMVDGYGTPLDEVNIIHAKELEN